MKRIIEYSIIAFGFSWTMWLLQYLGQEKIMPSWVQIFGMLGLFGPLVAFLLLTKEDGKSIKTTIKSLLTKPPKWTLYFIFLSPMILSAIAYLVYRGTQSGELQPIGVTWISIIPMAFIILLVGGPIEEFGWRGYLLPRLRSKYNVYVTIIILGFIHGLWHLPLHMLHGTVQESLPIYEFLIITVMVTVSYVFLYEYTTSLIPMIGLHWFANLSSAIFPYYYNTEGRYALLIGYVVLNIGLLLVLRQKNKQKEEFA